MGQTKWSAIESCVSLPENILSMARLFPVFGNTRYAFTNKRMMMRSGLAQVQQETPRPERFGGDESHGQRKKIFDNRWADER